MCLAADSFQSSESIQPVFFILFAKGVSYMAAT